MRPQYKFFAAVTLYYASLLGCSALEQHCQFMDLPGMACEASYGVVSDATYHQIFTNYKNNIPIGQVFIICLWSVLSQTKLVG